MSQNSQEKTCAGDSLNKAVTLFKKKRNSCKFCEVFQKIFFTEHLRTTVSDCTIQEKETIKLTKYFKSGCKIFFSNSFRFYSFRF